jgi:hypothetical protein
VNLPVPNPDNLDPAPTLPIVGKSFKTYGFVRLPKVGGGDPQNFPPAWILVGIEKNPGPFTRYFRTNARAHHTASTTIASNDEPKCR